LPVEFEHRVLWATKQLNFDLDKVGNLKKLQVFEIEKIQNEAYENAKITKSRLKYFTINSSNEKLISKTKCLALQF